jgi:hypothetical protein
MAIQLSTSLRNARLDVYETHIGTAPILEIRSGSQPANCAAADSGTLLASMTLPSDWMSAASSGSKDKSGTWQDASANNSGTIGHFRIKDSTGTTTHMQGTAGTSGDLVTDSATTTAGQTVTVNTFTLTAPGA